MSIYDMYGGAESAQGYWDSQREKSFDQALGKIENLENELIRVKAELKEAQSEIKRLKERNVYLEDSRVRRNHKINELKLDIMDYNAFGSDLLVDLMVSSYDSEPMYEFMKNCFDEDEVNSMRIEADDQIAEILKEDVDGRT